MESSQRENNQIETFLGDYNDENVGQTLEDSNETRAKRSSWFQSLIGIKTTKNQASDITLMEETMEKPPLAQELRKPGLLSWFGTAWKRRESLENLRKKRAISAPKLVTDPEGLQKALETARMDQLDVHPNHRHDLVQTNLPPLPHKAQDSHASSAFSDTDYERSKRHGMVVALLRGEMDDLPPSLKNYRVLELLGDGAFGFVMAAVKLDTGQEVAIKFIDKTKVRKESWVHSPVLGEMAPMEVHVLASLRHPNIIKFVDYIPSDEFLLLITEMHGTEWRWDNPALNRQRNPGIRSGPKSQPEEDSKDLLETSPLYRLTRDQEQSIRRRTSVDLFECIDAHHQIPLETCRFIFSQIAIAVYYLDRKGVVHRDLKDENIVIDADYKVKIIDFGSASIIARDPNKLFTKFKGTTQFGAPEVVGKKPYKGPPSEVWSLGVLLFTLIFGENPFSSKSEIVRGQLVWPAQPKLEPSCRDLIQGMLTVNPEIRFNIERVISHPWLAEQVGKLLTDYERWRSEVVKV